MLVKELIEELQKLDGEKTIGVYSDECDIMKEEEPGIYKDDSEDSKYDYLIFQDL